MATPAEKVLPRYIKVEDIPQVLKEIEAAPNKAIGAELRTLKTGPEIIDYISRKYPLVGKLFASSAQVSQNQTVAEHTLNFFARLKEHQQLAHYGTTVTAVQGRINIQPLFHIMVALHDIGKSIGAREEQLKYTKIVKDKLLTFWGFSELEIRFSNAIFNHDIIGGLLLARSQNTNSETNRNLYLAAVKELKQNCAQVKELSEQEFFYFQAIYYLSDAGAYDVLYNNYMKKISSNMFANTMKDNTFEELAKAFGIQSIYSSNVVATVVATNQPVVRENVVTLPFAKNMASLSHEDRLFNAVINNDANTVRRLISGELTNMQFMNVNEVREGYRPLDWAVEKNYWDIAGQLIACGASCFKYNSADLARIAKSDQYASKALNLGFGTDRNLLYFRYYNATAAERANYDANISSATAAASANAVAINTNTNSNTASAKK